LSYSNILKLFKTIYPMEQNKPSVSIENIKKTLEPVSQQIQDKNQKINLSSALSTISEANDVGANYGLRQDDFSTDSNNSTRFKPESVNIQDELEILKNNAQNINKVQEITRYNLNNILHSLFKILKVLEVDNVHTQMQDILNVPQGPNRISLENIQV
jgi:hypothetical protein